LDTASGAGPTGATEGVDFSALLSGGIIADSGITLSGISTNGSGAITVTATNTGASDLAVGSNLVHFAIQTTQDSLVEGPEVFPVTLTSAATVINGLVNTTIVDDDQAVWSITGTSTVQEGFNANYTIQLSGTLQAGETATTNLALADITTNSADYSSFLAAVNAAVAADPSHLSFSGGVLTFTSTGAPMAPINITLTAINDGITEGPEQYNISLSGPGSTTGANVTGTGTVLTTIIDNTTPTLSVPAAGGPGALVNETGLPIHVTGGGTSNNIVEAQGIGEAASSAPNSDQSEVTNGTITFSAPDGLDPTTGISINGQLVTGMVGQQIVGTTGTMMITSYSFNPGNGAGSVGYSYTLTDNTAGNSTSDVFAVVVKDATGDTVSQNLSINITDDNPALATPNTTIQNDAGAKALSLVQFSGGADGVGSLTFDISALPSPSGSSAIHTATGDVVHYALIADPNVANVQQLVGYVDVNSSGTYNAGTDTLVFTLSATNSSSGPGYGNYAFELFQPLKLPQTELNFSSSSIGAGGPATQLAVGADLLLTSQNPYGSNPNPVPPLNASNGFIGVSNNSMNPGELITYEFGTTVFSGGIYTIPNPEVVNDATIQVNNIGSSHDTFSFQWQAFKGGVLVGTGTDVWASSAVAANPITVTGGYDTLVMTVPNVANEGSFKMGAVDFTSISNPTPITLFLAAAVLDGDGDTTGSHAFTIAVNPFAGTETLPIANADYNTIAEDPITNVITGNVLTNDILGYGDATTAQNHTDNATIVGPHGTLVLSADGSYTYTLDDSNAAVQHLAVGQTLTDVFNYTLHDNAAHTSTSTLSIVIQGAHDAATLTAPSTLTASDAPTQTPLNLNMATNDNNLGDTLLMHISGLPTGMNASLNHGTLNTDGSYTLAPADLPGLQLFTDAPPAPSMTTIHVDVSSSEGASVLHSTADIHFSIVPII
jgi:VCBS repeat-containing protein